MADDHYEDSDGWLLATLNFLGGPSTRGQVINYGDFLNRAIFNDDEIDLGIRRLQRGGLAWCKDGKYSITRRGKKFVRKHCGWNLFKGAITEMLHLCKVMDGMKIDVVDDTPPAPIQPKMFQHDDCWFLVALYRMGRPATWDEVERADGIIEKGMFNRNAVRDGMERLQTAQLVAIDGDTYSITDRGRQLVARHEEKDQDWIVTMMGVTEELLSKNG